MCVLYQRLCECECGNDIPIEGIIIVCVAMLIKVSVLIIFGVISFIMIIHETDNRIYN